MSRMLLAGFVGATIVALPLVLSPVAAQAPDDSLRVARLVRELGADSFAVRDQATDELAKLGAKARGEIEAATRNPDPEVRLRAKDLLRAIKVFELWSAGKFNVPDHPVAAAEIVRALAEQTGNHLLVGDQFGTFHDEVVQLDAGPREYWQVLDDLCRRTGNRCRPHYDSRSPGVVVVAGVSGQQPLAYAGPVRGRITSARCAFNEELTYEDGRSEKTHTFQFNMEMTWEDRFKLVAYRSQPEVMSATTDCGQRLTGANPTAGGWNVASSGTRQLTMTLKMSPPPTTARALDTLHLSWGLIAVGDMVALEVTDLESRAPRFQDDVELIVDSFQPSMAGRHELVVIVRRDLNLPEPQEILFQEHELDLLDEAGAPLRKLGQTNALTEHGATFKASFLAAADQPAPKKLRFTYPRLRSQRELDIVFRNVPLPVGRPN